MQSGAHDLEHKFIRNNADWNESFPVRIGTGDDAQLMDLTNCGARMQLRANAFSATVYLDLFSPNGGITIDPIGIITIWASALVMWEQVPPGEYARDIVIQRGPQNVYAGYGRITVQRGITAPLGAVIA